MRFATAASAMKAMISRRPVRYEGVEVHVQVDGAAEALDRGDAAGSRIGHPEPPGPAPLPGEEGPHEDVEQPGGNARITSGRRGGSAGDGPSYHLLVVAVTAFAAQLVSGPSASTGASEQRAATAATLPVRG